MNTEKRDPTTISKIRNKQCSSNNFILPNTKKIERNKNICFFLIFIFVRKTTFIFISKRNPS
jgi:hypothetical protein